MEEATEQKRREKSEKSRNESRRARKRRKINSTGEEKRKRETETTKKKVYKLQTGRVAGKRRKRARRGGRECWKKLKKVVERNWSVPLACAAECNGISGSINLGGNKNTSRKDSEAGMTGVGLGLLVFMLLVCDDKGEEDWIVRMKIK